MAINFKTKLLIFWVCTILFLPSCKTLIKKRHIGKAVDYNDPWLCFVDDFPATCTIGKEDDWFIFDFTIRKGQAEGEYIIEGYADGTQGGAKSFRHIVTEETTFHLLLVSDGIIIDNIPFMPVGYSLSRKLPFKKIFNSSPFDAVGVYGKLFVSG